MADRVTQAEAEALVSSTAPGGRVTQAETEAVILPSTANVRLTQITFEPLVNGLPRVRATQALFEVLTKPESSIGLPTSTVSEGTTSIVVTIPTVADGDVMVAQIGFLGGTGVAITPPAGWTLIGRDDSGTTISQVVYYRVVASAVGEPASYTWTLDSSQKATGTILPFRGVKSNPILLSGGQANAASTNIDAPSIAPFGNYQLVTLWSQAAGNASTGGNFTAPTGQSLDTDINTTAGTTTQRISAGSSHTTTKNGTTGLQRAVSNNNNVSVARNLALRLTSATGRRPLILIN